MFKFIIYLKIIKYDVLSNNIFEESKDFHLIIVEFNIVIIVKMNISIIVMF